MKSFTLDEREEAREFFLQHGFVVFRDILTPEQVNQTRDEMWNQIEQASAMTVEQQAQGFLQKLLYQFGWYPVVKRDQPRTWDIPSWPFSSHGIGQQIARGPCAFENRQCPAVYDAFSHVIQEKELLVSLDRQGVILPGEGTSSSSWLHWDLNPWFATGVHTPPHHQLSPEQRKTNWLERWQRDNSAEKILLVENNNVESLDPMPVQGLIAIEDAPEDAGGFMCIPGIHQTLPSWAKSHPKSTDFTYLRIPSEDDELKAENAVRVSMRAGSLLIWSSALPHCNYQGNALRMCQYVKMIPASLYPSEDELDSQIHEARAKQIRRLSPPGFEFTELGKRLYGQEKWK